MGIPVITLTLKIFITTVYGKKTLQSCEVQFSLEKKKKKDESNFLKQTERQAPRSSQTLRCKLAIRVQMPRVDAWYAVVSSCLTLGSFDLVEADNHMLLDEIYICHRQPNSFNTWPFTLPANAVFALSSRRYCLVHLYPFAGTASKNIWLRKKQKTNQQQHVRLRRMFLKGHLVERQLRKIRFPLVLEKYYLRFGNWNSSPIVWCSCQKHLMLGGICLTSDPQNFYPKKKLLKIIP